MEVENIKKHEKKTRDKKAKRPRQGKAKESCPRPEWNEVPKKNAGRKTKKMRASTTTKPNQPFPDSDSIEVAHDRSLASKLKRERGTAATTPLPPEWRGPSKVSGQRAEILTPDDDGFSSCVEKCYRGTMQTDVRAGCLSS